MGRHWEWERTGNGEKIDRGSDTGYSIDRMFDVHAKPYTERWFSAIFRSRISAACGPTQALENKKSRLVSKEFRSKGFDNENRASCTTLRKRSSQTVWRYGACRIVAYRRSWYVLVMMSLCLQVAIL